MSSPAVSAALPALRRFAASSRPRSRSSTTHRTSTEGDAFLERALDAEIAVADTDIRGCFRLVSGVTIPKRSIPTYARSAACRQSMQPSAVFRTTAGLRMIDTTMKVS